MGPSAESMLSSYADAPAFGGCRRRGDSISVLMHPRVSLRGIGHFPQVDGPFPQWVVARKPVARHGSLHALLHAGQERPVFDHLHEGGAGVPHVEEVPLPAPLKMSGIAKPAPAEAGDLVVRS